MNDINEIYIFNSFQDEKSSILKTFKVNDIQWCEKAIYIQIKIQQEKFFKKMKKFIDSYEQWRKKSDLVTGEYYNNKEALVTATNKRIMLAKTIPKNVLSDMKALDRIPQIDLCNEINKRLDNLNTNFMQSNLEGKIDEYNLKEHKNNLS